MQSLVFGSDAGTELSISISSVCIVKATQPVRREGDEGLTECDVSNIISRFQSLQMTNFQRRFSIAVHDLRSGLTTRSSSRVDKLLEEDFAEDSIRFLFE